jgi:cell division transport system permease protein
MIRKLFDKARTRRSRSLGVAREARKYDLPLNKRAGTEFLVLLAALMTFMAIMFASGLYIFSNLTHHWRAGFENKITVEIPAQDNKGNLIPQSRMDKLADRSASVLRNQPAVRNVELMNAKEVARLVEPWLGQNDEILQEIPLPRLITVRLNKREAVELTSLETKIRNVAPHARIETHKDWLESLIKFIGAMEFAAMIMTFLVLVTMIITVYGAVRARIAIHFDELQLLHLMGASDNYISNQFQRYSFVTSLRGGIIGAIAAVICLYIIRFIAGDLHITLAPNFDFSTTYWFMICLAPLLIAVISYVTARWTTMRQLAKMP